MVCDVTILPVPVLAEPGLTPCSSRQEDPATNGEARESTLAECRMTVTAVSDEDSRGGQTLSSRDEVAIPQVASRGKIEPIHLGVPAWDWEWIEKFANEPVITRNGRRTNHG